MTFLHISKTKISELQSNNGLLKCICNITERNRLTDGQTYMQVESSTHPSQLFVCEKHTRQHARFKCSCAG